MTKSYLYTNRNQQIPTRSDCKKYDSADLRQQRDDPTTLPYYIKLSMRVIKYLTCLFGLADIFAHNKDGYIIYIIGIWYDRFGDVYVKKKGN